MGDTCLPRCRDIASRETSCRGQAPRTSCDLALTSRGLCGAGSWVCGPQGHFQRRRHQDSRPGPANAHRAARAWLQATDLPSENCSLRVAPSSGLRRAPALLLSLPSTPHL